MNLEKIQLPFSKYYPEMRLMNWWSYLRKFARSVSATATAMIGMATIETATMIETIGTAVIEIAGMGNTQGT